MNKKKEYLVVSVRFSDPEQVKNLDQLVELYRANRNAVIRIALDLLSERDLKDERKVARRT